MEIEDIFISDDLFSFWKISKTTEEKSYMCLIWNPIKTELTLIIFSALQIHMYILQHHIHIHIYAAGIQFMIQFLCSVKWYLCIIKSYSLYTSCCFIEQPAVPIARKHVRDIPHCDTLQGGIFDLSTASTDYDLFLVYIASSTTVQWG